MMINTRLEFNKAPDGSYIILPLKKEHNGLKVSTGVDTSDFDIDKNILEQLSAADKNRDNILTLDEVKNAENKNEFWERLRKEMETFDSNPHKDYRKSMFEFFV